MLTFRTLVFVTTLFLPGGVSAQGISAPEAAGISGSEQAGGTESGAGPIAAGSAAETNPDAAGALNSGADTRSSAFQCATFTCHEADPYCAFTTIGNDGRQASFRVNKNSTACFCELLQGDRYCFNPNGQFPGRGCFQFEVRGLGPTCPSTPEAGNTTGGEPAVPTQSGPEAPADTTAETSSPTQSDAGPPGKASHAAEAGLAAATEAKLGAAAPNPAFQCAIFTCHQADPSCAFTTIGRGGRQASFRVNANSRVCFCELLQGDRFCVSSNGQFPGRGCMQKDVRGLRPSCPSSAEYPPATASEGAGPTQPAGEARSDPATEASSEIPSGPTQSGAGTRDDAGPGAETSSNAASGPNSGSASSSSDLQCATFTCHQADPYCAFTTIGPDGRQASFHVNANSRICFCELRQGDRFCVNSNGEFPGRGCAQKDVRGLRPAC
jgi:hypothetical protein